MSHLTFLHSGALLGVHPDRFVVGIGPFEALPDRRADEAAFYCSDFFLHDPKPWKHPREWVEVNALELRHFLREVGTMPSVQWQAPRKDLFEQQFLALQKLLEQGLLTKGVPVVFERGQMCGAFPLGRILKRICVGSSEFYPYGIWDEHQGMLGATPEMLISQQDSHQLKTMALAGTASSPDFFTDKEKCEHQIVIDDIVESLACFGACQRGEAECIPFGKIHHLKTDLSIHVKNFLDLKEVVEKLHPTAALGASPRKPGWDWLCEQEALEQRGRFGAPFGFAWPDGRSMAVVAIRSMEWQGCDVRIGSGCGVVEGSQFDAEWEELRLKRQMVKELLWETSTVHAK
ncbi:MAG: chorismate-binding protein [Deltaproteobacteria bacterium]|nr:chorismate-binding protein [Deltaproteobacteria bacterium]